MPDILRDVQKELPKVISSANFEGANIVLYTDDMDFFKDNNGIIKELVNKFKNRIELRADSKLLKTHEETEKIIKETIPEDAGLTEILFDSPENASTFDTTERISFEVRYRTVGGTSLNGASCTLTFNGSDYTMINPVGSAYKYLNFELPSSVGSFSYSVACTKSGYASASQDQVL